MASPIKRSNHVQPLDREGPSYGDCLERSRGHMALIGEELATNAMLNKVLCMCRQPMKSMTKSFSNERFRAGMMATVSFMNLP